MKHIVVFVVAAALLALSGPAFAVISPNTRLLQRPEWDGEVFINPWIYGQMRYQYFSSDIDTVNGKGSNKTSVFAIGPTFAMPIPNAEQLELGGRVWLMSTSTKIDKIDLKGSGTGLSDIDLWGKYQFIDDPVKLSGGLLFTLPTGAEKVISPWATGKFNVELFGALRYYIADNFALASHLGLRINGDAEYKIKDTKVELDGKASFELGGGIIYQVDDQLNILGELNFGTEPYKDADNDIELTGGIEYALQENFSLRGGLGIGLDEVAPDFELMGGASYAF
jgi:hypothetical protein